MAYLGLVDDEYDDYDDLSDRNRPLPPRPAPPREDRNGPRSGGYEDDRDPYGDSRANEPRVAQVTRIRPMNQAGDPVSGPGGTNLATGGSRPTMVTKTNSESGRVHVVAPLRFADAKEIGDFIRQSNPVIVNLQGADRDLQRRMIDFCSGIAYAVGCSMERVADQVFLLTPDDVTVSAEERARLERRGFNRDD
jgi:cell division inhibitor SepF